MSWDIVIFSYKEQIQAIEDIDESKFVPTNFSAALEKYFQDIVKDKDHRSIQGKDFNIDYFSEDEESGNMIVNIYGENGLYALVLLAQKQNWQLFDTSRGEMIDLKNPANNGYKKFQDYVQYIIKNKT